MGERLSRRIVFVHGCGPKPPADGLHTLWREALTEGLRRDEPDLVEQFGDVPSEFIYYADKTGVAVKPEFDPKLDLDNRRSALAELKKLTKTRDFRRRSYDALPGKSATKEFLMDASATLGASRFVMKHKLPELDSYLAGDQWGKEVRGELCNQLKAALNKEEEILLVGHCLGSVLAYDALWSLSREDEIANRVSLVTLGSALSDRSVQGRLLGASAGGAAMYPNNINVWHNLSAEDDYVCHDKTVADDFRAMLTHRLLGDIKDFTIYNLAVRYGRSNAHSSVGYLIHPRTSKILAEWLQRDPD